MRFKNFSIWLIKNLIILLLITLIFSSITLDLPDLIKGVFGDIFAYADTDTQKKVVSKLTETCSLLDKGQELVTTNQFSKIGALCKDYNAGKINDKEFFSNVVGGAIPTEQMQTLNIGFLEKYNKSINYLNKNKILYFIVLTVLLVLLYLLIMDTKLFVLTLTNISLSIGILIMLPYFAVIAYDKFVGIDTTSILGSMFGEGAFDFKAIISVILLLFLRTYNSLIITLGVVSLSISIIGKVYSWRFKKDGKTAETKKSEKASKKLKEEEKESPKDDRERKKSTKEILDELEEMHKKKTKKD